MSIKNMYAPVCGRCQQTMTWVSEQIVDNKPMQVFYCETCDKFAAALPGTNGISTGIPPGVATGL
jgi:hypothetical protein